MLLLAGSTNLFCIFFSQLFPAQDVFKWPLHLWAQCNYNRGQHGSHDRSGCGNKNFILALRCCNLPYVSHLSKTSFSDFSGSFYVLLKLKSVIFNSKTRNYWLFTMCLAYIWVKMIWKAIIISFIGVKLSVSSDRIICIILS